MLLSRLASETYAGEGKALEKRGSFGFCVSEFRPSSVDSGKSGAVVDRYILPRVGREKSGGGERWDAGGL